MPASPSSVLDRLVHWAGSLEEIRAVLLYSSRTNPDAPVDELSDYDLLLAGEARR